MITGFNTDVPHGGVTYHVQTEDKGLDTPLILSLVYVGGAIIAAKRTPYEDLISKGFDEKTLTERLQRQHKLICAAIKSGRVEDLKRMGGANDAQEPAVEAGAAVPTAKKSGGQKRKKAEAAPPPPPPAAEEVATPQAEEVATPPEAEAASPEAASPEAASPSAEESAPTPVESAKAEPEIVILASLADEISALDDFTPPRVVAKPPEPPAEVRSAQGAVIPFSEAVAAGQMLTAEILGAPPQELSGELYLTLLDDEGEFRAGQLATVKVYVGRGSYGQSPEAEASVTVKVLGTSFRPLILSTATDAQGVGVVRALLPRFTSGRAAIIIRAVAGDDAAEMRRIIHQ